MPTELSKQHGRWSQSSEPAAFGRYTRRSLGDDISGGSIPSEQSPAQGARTPDPGCIHQSAQWSTRATGDDSRALLSSQPAPTGVAQALSTDVLYQNAQAVLGATFL